MHALKEHAEHLSGHLPVLYIDNIDILGPDDDIYRLLFLKSKIHTVKCDIIKPHLVILEHDTRDDIALSDEICNIPVCRLVVYLFRRTDLLDLSALHDNDLIRHRQRLFLIVCDKDKGNADLLLNPLQLVLHLLAQLQVKCRQRLVEQQHLRLIDQRPCDRDTLLLSTGKQRRIFIFKSLQADQPEHLHDLLVDDILTHLFDLQTKRNVLVD